MTEEEEKELLKDDPLWHVAHTRPRCEKKLAIYCDRLDIPFTLPTYRSVRRYPGKVVEFHKPLFPGYLFVRVPYSLRQKVYQSDYVANFLKVPDQEVFEAQLEDILAALETDLEIRPVPTIQEGARVRIKSGPLKGMEGWVEKRTGQIEVHLRLDFIGKAAAVKMTVDQLEPL